MKRGDSSNFFTIIMLILIVGSLLFGWGGRPYSREYGYEDEYSEQEVYTEEGKTAYIDMIKFLEGYFNISQNFKEFLSLLKKKAGLLIISYNKIKININRFQNLFDKKDTSILIKELKIST